MLRIAMHSQSRLSGGAASFFSNLRDAIDCYNYAKIVRPYNLLQDIGLYSSVARQPFRFPYILRIDGIYFDKRNTFGDNAELNKKIFTSITNASGVLFQSEFSRHLVESHYGKISVPHTVILNGARIDVGCRKGDSDDKKMIVCSANWRPNKRLGAIVETVQKLRKSIDCELFILGELGENKIEESDYIHVLGRQSRAVVSEYLSQADLFIHLSWLDPCPNSVVEAISHGVPVVCSNQGGTPEIVRSASGGRVSLCDEDIDYNGLVDLHHPPQPDIGVVVRDVEELLGNTIAAIEEMDFSAVDIRSTAKRYVSFCQQVLDG